MDEIRFKYWADVIEQEGEHYDRIASRLRDDFATARHFGLEYIRAKVTEYRRKAEHCRETAAVYRAKVLKL
jgi:hypothetical protein